MKGLIFLALLAIGGIGAIASSAGSSSSSTSSSSSHRAGVPTTHTVTYKVEGSTSMASITYSNPYGDTSQQSDIDVPLTLKDGTPGIQMSGMHRGDFLYISAQNSKEYGSVTCAIEVDGIRVKENTSRGAFTIATCSGSL